MVKSIYTKRDALEAETRIDELVALKKPSFEEEEELNILSVLFTSWEDENIDFPASSTLDVVGNIQFMMDQRGPTKQSELVGQVFANKVRGSEVFNSKRLPTIQEVKKLNSFLKIPYEMLIG